MVTGTPWVASCTVTVDQDLVEVCSGPEAADSLTYGAFGDGGTREFFTHVRFHKHDEDKITIHLLVELYARSAEEATEVLEEASRGVLHDHLARRGESRPARRAERPSDSATSERVHSPPQASSRALLASLLRAAAPRSCAAGSGRRSARSARGSAAAPAASPSGSTRSSSAMLVVADVEAARCRSRPAPARRPARRLDRVGLALAAAEDPRQHAAVLAEARPQELAVVVLAEPVDVEELRQLRRVALLADLAASARSSRPCGSRRTAASRTGRSAACRRRPRRRRSSPRT